MASRDQTCSFIAIKDDASTWYGEQWALLERDRWECPHSQLEGREHDYCAFHTPPEDVPDHIDETELFINSINEGRNKENEYLPSRKTEFIGAKFGEFKLPTEITLCEDAEYPIRFDNALFSKGFVAENVTFESGVSAQQTQFIIPEEQQVSFTQSVFDGEWGVRFRNSEFSGDGAVSFLNAKFNCSASFEGVNFSNENRVSFSRTEFDGGNRISFEDAKFNGDVAFLEAELSGDRVSFEDAEFINDGDVDFEGSIFSGSDGIDFTETEFVGQGNVSFLKTEFVSDSWVSFGRAIFNNNGRIIFGQTKFRGNSGVSFRGAEFSGEGRIGFGQAVFNNAKDVHLSSIECSIDGDVSFKEVEFNCGGVVSYDRTSFDNVGNVSFEGVEFGEQERDVEIDSDVNVSFEQAEYDGNGSILFPGLDLAGTNFRGVNFSSIDFSGANLSRADFRGAKFSAIDLREADLSEIMLNGETQFSRYPEDPASFPSQSRSLSQFLSHPRQAGVVGDQLEPEDWDGIARSYHALKARFSEHGLVGQARRYHQLEREARGKEAKSVKDYKNYVGSLASRYLTGYGVGYLRVLIIMSLLFIPSTVVYWNWGIESSIYYSVVTFTTSPPSPPPSGLPQIIAIIETFLGTVLVVLLGYVLGNRESF